MKDYPVIKAAILFVLGILTSQLFEVGLLVIAFAFIICLSLLVLNKKFSSTGKFSFISFMLTGILILLFGNYLANRNETVFNPVLSEINKVKNTTAYGKIVNIDLLKNDELIFYISVDSMLSDEFSITCKFNLLCKFKGSKKILNQFYDELKPGNKLKVTGFYHKGKERRNPGEFDYNVYLNSKSIIGVLNLEGKESVSILNSEINEFNNLIYQVRIAIDNRIKEYYSVETAALLRGLLLADRGEISYQTKNEFINAGVVHVLAVSGLHVGYIIMIFLVVFGRFNIYLKSILTIIGLIIFMLITGVPPSVFRATVMAVVLIIAYLTNRSTNLLNSISIAAIIILILDTNEIYNPGFQLSFAAVLAIGIILPYLNNLINKWNIQNRLLKYIFLFCAVSLSAQVGTLPFTLLYFNKFSVIALVTNFVVIPSIGLIVASTIAGLLISVIIPPIAIYFAGFTDLFTSLILSIIKFSGNLSFSYLSINDYSIIDLIIFYLMLSVLLIFLPRFQSVRSKIILLVLIILNTFIYSSVDDEDLLPEHFLSILMIDVDQGDSFLIKFPNGETALVDAGNATNYFDNGERVILPLLNYLGIDKIDYGIVSHIDSDHYGGFISLMLTGKINKILKPSVDTTLSKDKKFESFARSLEIPINYFRNEKLEIGNTALYFLNDDNLNRLHSNSTNDKSGVFKLIYGNTSILFTGDIEKSVEKYYSAKYKYFLDSDILKVAHHGSKTSSTELFLEYVSPQISLVSAGFKNKFGHPAEEILKRLMDNGSSIYRTDLEKAILVQSNGQQIEIINW